MPNIQVKGNFFQTLLTLLLTLYGLNSQKTNQGGLGLSGSVQQLLYQHTDKHTQRTDCTIRATEVFDIRNYHTFALYMLLIYKYANERVNSTVTPNHSL